MTSGKTDESVTLASPTWATLPCIHCGEPTEVPSLSQPERVFCCGGCRGAHELIHGWGLEEFYALREQAKLTGNAQAASRSSRYDQFDSSAYLGPSTPIRNADGKCSTQLAIHGLHCGACAWLIENAAKREPGLVHTRVQLNNHTIRLVFDPAETQLSRIAEFLDKLGYQLSPFNPKSGAHTQLESRRLLVQMSIAGFLAANAMWIAIALYAGEYSGVSTEHRYFLKLTGTLLGVAAVLGPGRSFFVGALASLRTGTPHMDLPVALGLSVGAIVGSINAIGGQGQVYFDSLATLVFLLLIGRWIQFRQQSRATRAVDLMLRLTPSHAELEREDRSTHTVLVDTLLPGDIIAVAPGDVLTADGEILEGQTKLDRSLLTGESMPVQAQAGDSVSAGIVNLTGPIRVRVSATGEDSRIGRVLQSVESAANDKTPILMLADRIGRWFVVVITLLASLAFVWWLPAGLGIATSNATALLIVACPCALALATPMAIAVGLGRAAHHGILIRDGSQLQQLARPGRLWFDKTGTLTEGKLSVTQIHGSLEGLMLAAAVEIECNHPIAQAIVREARLRKLDHPLPTKCIEVVQGGVIGQASGQQVCVGNIEFMRSQGVLVEPEFQARMLACLEANASPTLISIGGKVVTVVGVSDSLRSEATQVVASLQKLGWRIGILSGDHQEIVLQVGRQLCLDAKECHGGLSPEEKLTMIQGTDTTSPVAMIGDGANDAAALAAADIGIAVRGGAEVSLKAAPIYIANGGLLGLPQLFQGSTKTTRLIHQTFGISLVYNMIAVGFALTGNISPLAAAILMPLSSVSVLAVILATKTFVGTKERQ